MFSKSRSKGERPPGSSVHGVTRGTGPATSWGAPRGVSLSFLLTAWYTTVSLLLVAASVGLFYFGLAESLKTLSRNLLRDELDVCRALVKARSGDLYALREEAEIDSYIRKYEKFYVRVIDQRGNALATTPGMDRELSALRISAAAARYPGDVFWLQSPSGLEYRGLVADIASNPDGTGFWTLQVAVELTQEQDVLSRLRIWCWAVLAAALIVCPWTGLIIARRGTATLKEVAETARHISSSTLDERIRARRYPSEIAVLADAFNSMLQRLEDSFARLSRFSADIAHELRTPVNNIRGGSEVALARERPVGEYREALGSCLEESVRLSDLIESLLFLARSESPGEHLRREPLDIGALLADVRDYYDAAATEAGVTLTASGGAGLVAEVDKQLLQRAIENLTSNALAHTPPGGRVTLKARCDPEGIRIEIEDTGCGIPSDALPRVFDRFFRADPARSRDSGGAGLGLAIVRQIAVLHGGNVEIRSEPERGVLVTVTVPQSASHAVA